MWLDRRNCPGAYTEVAYAQRLLLPLPLCDSYSASSLNANCVMGVIQKVLETNCDHVLTMLFMLTWGAELGYC